jgi:methanogenic corrinoid protein MtbC1
LRTIAQLAQQGRPIGELMAEFRAGGLAPAETLSEAGLAGSVTQLVDCLVRGELDEGEVLYGRLTSGLSPAEVISRVIAPSWIDTGERWFRRECAVFQERIVSGFLVRKLETMIEAARHSNVQPARTVVVGTVQGDRHAGGVLMVSLILEQAGWRTINLGVDLPVREYLGAIRQWHCDALALSFVLSRNIKKRFQELLQIRGLPVFVGGRSILNHQGLARRHGLIPVHGPVATAVPQLLVAYDQWVQTRRPGRAPEP